MILTIDVGNSNTVIGGISEGEVKFVSRMETEQGRTEDQYAIYFREILSLYGFCKADFNGSIISSVVPPITIVFKGAVEKAIGLTPMLIGPGIKTGINIQTDNPAQVGADIIMCNLAARSLYKTAVIVVDMGTATTISATDKNGNFKGCAIMPGVSISKNALSKNTAQLQEIALGNPKKTIGTNTVESMKSGIVYGNACMIDGMVERFLDELLEDDVTIVTTGGHSKYITPYCKNNLLYNQNLLLIGLYIAYSMNTKKHPTGVVYPLGTI